LQIQVLEEGEEAVVEIRVVLVVQDKLVQLVLLLFPMTLLQ
jgi:hypothetical protein